MVDDQHINQSPSPLQSQAELLLNGGKKAGLRGIVGTFTEHPVEQGFVRRELQVEIVPCGETGLIQHRVVERDTLHHRCQLSHSRTAARGGGPSGEASGDTVLSFSFDPPFAMVSA